MPFPAGCTIREWVSALSAMFQRFQRRHSNTPMHDIQQLFVLLTLWLKGLFDVESWLPSSGTYLCQALGHIAT
jgi:hypothetical protein